MVSAVGASGGAAEPRVALLLSDILPHPNDELAASSILFIALVILDVAAL